MVLGLLHGGWAHSLYTRDVWVMPHCWTHPSAHVALGFLPRCWVHQRIRDAWAARGELWLRPIGDKWRLVHSSGLKGMGRTSGPMINRSNVRIQFYWVLHQDSTFMGPKILNIIICFRNIIIIIIIIIIK